MLQYIAMLTMLVDHIGIMFFPETDILRMIGRIAFPLYCWFLVQGYHHTRSIKKYGQRLVYSALLSQLPYSLAFQTWELNVIFTLCMGLGLLYILDYSGSRLLQIAAVPCIVLATLFLPMDYGIYGCLLVVVYRYFKGWTMVAGHLSVTLLIFSANGFNDGIQFFSLAGSLLILYGQAFKPQHAVKWLYRTFYPVHLTVLFGLKWLLPS